MNVKEAVRHGMSTLFIFPDIYGFLYKVKDDGGSQNIEVFGYSKHHCSLIATTPGRRVPLFNEPEDCGFVAFDW